MDRWSQFLIVAGAHFLALLSPGPDFFLIVRSAIRHGARQAGSVCIGISGANAVFIAMALAGISLLGSNAWLFQVLKWSGCAYLAWLGWCFLKHTPKAEETHATASATRLHWWQGFTSGFLSAILNPKNSLFYASLFTLVIRQDTPGYLRVGYGCWMAGVVLAWDLAIASAAVHPRVIKRFMHHVGIVEKSSGLVLLAIALGVVLGSCWP